MTAQVLEIMPIWWYRFVLCRHNVEVRLDISPRVAQCGKWSKRLGRADLQFGWRGVAETTRVERRGSKALQEQVRRVQQAAAASGMLMPVKFISVCSTITSNAVLFGGGGGIWMKIFLLRSFSLIAVSLSFPVFFWGSVYCITHYMCIVIVNFCNYVPVSWLYLGSFLLDKQWDRNATMPAFLCCRLRRLLKQVPTMWFCLEHCN